VNWIISKKDKIKEIKFLPGKGYFYHFDYKVFEKDGITIVLNGYVLPRMDYFEKFNNVRGIELIYVLYKESGPDFIRKIKGVFTIMLIDRNIIRIYNDIHGLSKFFIWQNGEDFVISNRISFARDYSQAPVDIENLAIYCLLEHFVKDITAFKGIRQSLPASMISYDGSLTETRYWLPEELFDLREKLFDPAEKVFDPQGKFSQLPEERLNEGFFSGFWIKLVNEYVSALGLKEIALTLTGGCDSRLVLAGLVKSGININAFSYGNPDSADAILANTISKRLNLNYSNHHVLAPSAMWLKDTWMKIGNFGETLINLHRAHRYQAAIDEKTKNPRSEAVFTGLMGGEYLRGIEYDGYIISDYFKSPRHVSRNAKLKRIKNILLQRGINTNAIDLKVLYDKVETLLSDFSIKKDKKEFLLAFYIYGCAHHLQDSMIYMNQFNYVVNPFMDIDFLEMISGSNYVSFNHKKGIYNWLWAPEFQVSLTHILLPEISDIPYNKRGYFTANNFCDNRISYFKKRMSGILSGTKYPSNFQYDKWMQEFVQEQFSNLSSTIASVFFVDKIIRDLNKSPEITTEKYWHNYTNPINLNQIIK